MKQKIACATGIVLLLLFCHLSAKALSDIAQAASEPNETPQAYSDKAWTASQRGDLEQAVTLWAKAAEGFRDAQKPKAPWRAGTEREVAQ